MNTAKLSTTIIVLLGLLIFLPIFAAATPSITETSIKLTADYNQFVDDDEDTISVVTESFTVINDDPINAITVKAIGLSSGYSSQPVTVPVNTTTLVTLTVEVPHENSPGTKNIGTVVITDPNNVQLDSADLTQETAEMLELTELEVKYVDSSGKTQKDEFNTADLTYSLENEVKPYTNITFTFDLQNRFDHDYPNKGELEEVELTIDVDDSDLFEDDIKDSYKFEKIEAGKDAKYIVTLPISEEVGADTYNLEFTFSVEDGEGIQYEIKKELVVEIELDDEDVRIVKAQVYPETVTVCDKEASLEVKVHNFGSDDQDTVKVTLFNEELGLDQNIENIAIDSHTEDDHNWLKTFNIPLLADSNVKTYFLDLKTYIGSSLSDLKVVELSVQPCATAEEPVVEEEEQPLMPAQPETGEETAEQPLTGNVIKSIEKLSYTSNDYLVALMLMAIAVTAGLVVLMLIILFKNK